MVKPAGQLSTHEVSGVNPIELSVNLAVMDSTVKSVNGHTSGTTRPRALLLALATAASCLSGCTAWKSSPQPATLVIMIENLGFNSFSCAEASAVPEEVLFEGFCRESVRFTHAYAPSTMSQPTVASIMTGLYPVEHGVRHNGATGLSALTETVGEKAKLQGYRTSFFSGGPPIFRRSGFNQGMDVFDDGFPVSMKQLYRPASQIVELFLNWESSANTNGKFLSFLFFADPQFLDQPTTNELGDVRESSYQSQVTEVSESLERLVREMKKRKIWDTTNVFLVGLNGFVSNSRAGEPGATNLFFESTRATLMMKPARKMKEAPFNWKIDANVSLVDVGVTLLDFFGGPSANQKSKLEPVSLSTVMTSATPDWDADRKLIIESAWPKWKTGGEPRAALRRGPYLYLFDENDQLYNTLTDNLEVSPLLLADPSVSRLRDDFASTLRELGYVPWKRRAPHTLAVAAKTLLAQDLWREHQLTPELENRLLLLSQKYPDDSELLGWRANLAIQNGNWAALKRAAGKNHAAWTYVADANLIAAGADKKLKREPLADNCLRALLMRDRDVGKDCGDPLSRDLSIWSNEKTERWARERAMEAFLKGVSAKVVTDRIARASMIAGNVWDVAKGRWSEPSLSDLMLALPEMKKYRATVRARIASESR